MINSGIHPIQNLSVLKHVAELTGDDSKKAYWAKYHINKGFIGMPIEVPLLQTSGGKTKSGARGSRTLYESWGRGVKFNLSLAV